VIKALTLIQPWATLIADGRKLIETRSWSTDYRGLLAIHAGKKLDREAAERFGYDPDALPRGQIVALAELWECVCFPSDLAPPDPYGDFAAGRFGFLLRNVREARSSSLPGRLGLWDLEEAMALAAQGAMTP
jgi:hypothetical protein